MVNSKADKTGGHKSSGLKTKSYSQASAAPAPQGISAPGQKALMFRARKELADLANPAVSPAE